MNSIQEKLFVEFWNSDIKAKELVKLFNFSSDTRLYREIKKLQLINKRDSKHPYNIELNNEIKKLYLIGYSIKIISEKLKRNHDSVHKRLIKLNVKRRSCHNRNVLLYKSKQLKSPYSALEIITYIKDNYPKKTPYMLSKELKCDTSTIKIRIKALGLN